MHRRFIFWSSWRGGGDGVIPEIEKRAAEIEHGNNQTQAAEAPARARPAAVLRRAAAANEPLLFSETDFQLACAALSDQHEAVVHSGRRLAEALVERAKKAGSRAGLARVRAELAEALARGQGRGQGARIHQPCVVAPGQCRLRLPDDRRMVAQLLDGPGRRGRTSGRLGRRSAPFRLSPHRHV